MTGEGRKLLDSKQALWEILLPAGTDQDLQSGRTSTSPRLEGKSAPRAYAWSYQLRKADPYWQRAQEALQRICHHPYLPGTMRWLRQANPWLYKRLMEDLPRQIDKLWDAGAPLEKFQGVLDRWVDAHRAAYVAYERFSAQGPRNTKA